MVGYITPILDDYTKEFANHAASMKLPVADLGAGFGFSTKHILEKGATVFSNDVEIESLEALKKSCSKEELNRLYLIPGKLPKAFSFEEGQLGGVLASRCFHFLTGDEIESLVFSIYKSLSKGGLLCIVAETPYLGYLKSFIPIYEKRKKSGRRWPGFIRLMKKYTNKVPSSQWVNLLDSETLKRVLTEAGFEIQKSGFVNRTYFPEEIRLSGKESVGILAIKK